MVHVVVLVVAFYRRVLLSLSVFCLCMWVVSLLACGYVVARVVIPWMWLEYLIRRVWVVPTLPTDTTVLDESKRREKIPSHVPPNRCKESSLVVYGTQPSL